MSTLCCLVSLISASWGAQAQAPSQRYFDNLVQWRKQFEGVLKDPDEDIGYTHLWSEMLGGAHSDVLYPVGSAAERFVIFFDEGNSGTLMFEKRHKSVARVEWHIPLTSTTEKAAAHGTIRAYLLSLGMRINRGTRLSRPERSQLSATGSYAGYSFHPMMGGYTWLVKPDGTRTKDVRNPAEYSINPDEKALLIRGRKETTRALQETRHRA